MERTLGIAIVGGVVILVALAMILVVVPDITSVEVTPTSVKVGALGGEAPVHSENQIQQLEPSSLDGLEPTQREHLQQQLDDLKKQQTRDSQEQLENLQQQIDDLKKQDVKEQPDLERQMLDYQGTWNVSGNSYGYSLSAWIILYDNTEYEMEGNIGGAPLQSVGNYNIDTNNGIFTMVNEIGQISSYYITDQRIDSFLLSNPLTGEFYSFMRN